MSSIAPRRAGQSPPISGRGQRDYRLDFFRGLVLFFIFVDHIPDNPVAYMTLRAFAFADAAEVFIFISGYTAALVYGQKMLRDGAVFATALIWRRAWQLYLAHLCLFMLYSAQVAYTVQRFSNPLFSDELGIADFLSKPEETLIRVLLLEFQPAFLDILPLYICLLVFFPVFMLAMRRHILLALVPSFALYALARITGLNLPGNTDSDGWFFNPLAWQFLFIIGACLGYAQATGLRLPLAGWQRQLLLGTAGLGALAEMVIQLSWTLHQVDPRVPGLLMQTLWPLDKSTLAPARLLSVLALVVLVGAFVPRDASFMTSRAGWVIVLCGQNSLHVFCLSILLSVMANTLLTFVSKTWLTIFAVNMGGILIMVGLGLLTAWYGANGKLPHRPMARAGAA